MGRWMSPDWADKPEAVPYSDLGNPQSLNLYGYVNNNPLSKADKDGHCPECVAPSGYVPGGSLTDDKSNSVFMSSKARAASPTGDKTNTGPKVADAPGVTAGGQATAKYGNKVGPSGKNQVDQVDHSGKKGAKDAAREEGKGAPEKHPSPTKGDPHYHPTDADGEKQPNSTHRTYPN